MIGVQFKRFNGEYKADCESCGSEINTDQPFFELYFKDIHQTVHICEYCGKDLQNDISDEYIKFTVLGQ